MSPSPSALEGGRQRPKHERRQEAHQEFQEFERRCREWKLDEILTQESLIHLYLVRGNTIWKN